jgi:hypothetical protein
MPTAIESDGFDALTAETTWLLHGEQEGEITSQAKSTELDRSGYWSLLFQHVSR